jgi:DNA polymerase-3 subunit gamma/tau
VAEQALYRKYRSADFSQVVGQDHVVKTLTTAIASGRTSHAYLFTGPRGVGKTSVDQFLA